MQNPGPWWQWMGLVATLIGTGFSLWAALAAQSARRQAKRAVAEAIRLGRIVQITDLIMELKEVETLLPVPDLTVMVGKAAHLRGRILRFRSEAYNELTEAELGTLLLATEQLAGIVLIVAGRKQTTNKVAAIRVAIGQVNDSLNAVAGSRVAAGREVR